MVENAEASGAQLVADGDGDRHEDHGNDDVQRHLQRQRIIHGHRLYRRGFRGSVCRNKTKTKKQTLTFTTKTKLCHVTSTGRRLAELLSSGCVSVGKNS